MGNGSKPPGAVTVTVSAAYEGFTQSMTINIDCNSQYEAERNYVQVLSAVESVKDRKKLG